MLIHIRVKSKDTNFGCWLPLFLLFPIILAVLIILSPLILIALFVIWISGRGNWGLFTLKTAFIAFWSLRGLKVDVQGKNEIVQISVI
jgi:hypothetical protein